MNIIKDLVNKKDVLQSIDKIEYVVNFIPSNLRWLTETDIISYEGFNLKTSILLDIIHGLRVKYNIYDEKNSRNGFPLSSVIMMGNYGNQYRRYIEYLTDHYGKFGINNIPIFRKTKNHMAGKNSTCFALNGYYLKENYFYHKNYHKKIIKRKKNQILRFISEEKYSIIPVDIRLKLYKDLRKFTVDPIGSKHTLDVLHEQGKINALKYKRNLKTVETILEGVIECSADQHGRIHTIITRLKREVRSKNLLVETDSLEQTIEFDIKNSQPTMFLKILRDNLLEIDVKEFYRYKDICKNGEVYDRLIKCYAMCTDKIIINRKQAKELTYTYLFGPPINLNKCKKDKKRLRNAFIKILGVSIDKWLTTFKLNHSKGYKAFSWLLQKYESNFIFDIVIRKIIEADPTIPIATVHDSIIVPKSKRIICGKIFDDSIEQIFEDL